MSSVAMNTSGLPIVDKLVKGQTVITNSINNPNVPGNTALLAAFSTAETNLTAANAAYEDISKQAKELLAARDTAEGAWDGALPPLAAFTEAPPAATPRRS